MSALKHSLFFSSEIINRMTYAMNNNVDLKDLEELEDLKLRLKQVRLLEKLGKQGFHNDQKEIFEPIAKTVTDISQKLIEKTKSTTKPIEEMDESNVYADPFQLIIENGVIDSRLIRPIAKLLLLTNIIQFWVYDHPDSDNCNDYTMNGEKFTKDGDRSVFKNRGKTFTWRGDVLKMITDYKFTITQSTDAKLNIDFMDESRFDIQAWGECLKFQKNYFFN